MQIMIDEPEAAQKAKQYGSLRKVNMSEKPAAPVAKHGEPILLLDVLQCSISHYMYITYQTIQEGTVELVVLRYSGPRLLVSTR